MSEPIKSPIVESVEKLDADFKAMTELTGQIIATLIVNRERNSITSKDNKQFDELITSWQNRFRSIGQSTAYKSNPPTDDL